MFKDDIEANGYAKLGVFSEKKPKYIETKVPKETNKILLTYRTKIKFVENHTWRCLCVYSRPVPQGTIWMITSKFYTHALKNHS